MRGLLVVLCLLAPFVPLAASASAEPTPVFRISDQRIDEASGIASGIRSPGVVYVHNDSGDRARFFALDAKSGQVLAEYDVPGVTADDWEDIAVAPDADGTPSVWLADTGDNTHARSEVQLYRVDEPAVDLSRHDVVTSTARADVWRLRYPSGPADAESLAVSPRGVPYVITKSLDGRSAVYSAPPTPDAATVRMLVRVGAIRFMFTGTPGPFAPIGQLTATGADLSRNGTRFVVRTYTDAYLWQVQDGDLAAALRTDPVHIALPAETQGEGVCFAGAYLLVDSEGVDSPVYRVPVPRPPTPPSPTVRSSHPPVSLPPVSHQPPSTPAADAESTPSNDALTYALAAAAALAIAAVGLVEVTRRRRS